MSTRITIMHTQIRNCLSSTDMLPFLHQTNGLPIQNPYRTHTLCRTPFFFNKDVGVVIGFKFYKFKQLIDRNNFNVILTVDIKIDLNRVFQLCKIYFKHFPKEFHFQLVEGDYMGEVITYLASCQLQSPLYNHRELKYHSLVPGLRHI